MHYHTKGIHFEYWQPSWNISFFFLEQVCILLFRANKSNTICNSIIERLVITEDCFFMKNGGHIEFWQPSWNFCVIF